MEYLSTFKIKGIIVDASVNKFHNHNLWYVNIKNNEGTHLVALWDDIRNFDRSKIKVGNEITVKGNVHNIHGEKISYLRVVEMA